MSSQDDAYDIHDEVPYPTFNTPSFSSSDRLGKWVDVVALIRSESRKKLYSRDIISHESLCVFCFGGEKVHDQHSIIFLSLVKDTPLPWSGGLVTGVNILTRYKHGIFATLLFLYCPSSDVSICIGLRKSQSSVPHSRKRL